MSNNKVVFIAFLEQDNLGVGYMASVLIQDKFNLKIVDFRESKENIFRLLSDFQPILTGFSIIFQYHIDEFKSLINYLRKYGINCHFCAGGHYPSLRYEELLNIIPELDSVVLFEGEHTMLDLAQSLRAGNDWKQTDGLAYGENGLIKANPLRPLESNLDVFPAPVRMPLREYAFGKKYATILAGRGCYYDCSFCSIRQFYSKPKGPIKRYRRPEMAAREIELLNEELDCSIFMFQDDDFPVSSSREKEWTARFCQYLNEKKLGQKIMWKINCRPDEIEKDLFELMRDAGLFLVYLGIEDGTDYGLELMNKHVTADQVAEAVKLIKELGIMYDYGFMMFNPESTFETVTANLDFLEKICGDGSSPVTFSKMLPYAETAIESKLKNEGRLRSNRGFADYDFRDRQLDHFYNFVTSCFTDWISKNDGLLNTARWGRYYLAVYKKYYESTAQFQEIENEFIACVARSNLFLIKMMTSLAFLFDSKVDTRADYEELKLTQNVIDETHLKFKTRLHSLMDQMKKL